MMVKTMLGPILGCRNSERILVFIQARNEGYATEIARRYKTDLYGIQRQLDRLETGGVLVSRKVGRTRVYIFNPRYQLLPQLKDLLQKAISFYPMAEREALLMNRRRPRRRGKPL
ncbi:MAG: winged helix-turn-helix domain-containing protein [Anaerolineales bacterium]|nr:winged helix-turn-helix domain-containing protein [Anaerolineales bacterium]